MNLLIAASMFLATSVDANKKIIVVIDTGVNTTKELKGKLCSSFIDLTGKGIQDVVGHGTNIASIIARQVGNDYCIFPIKFFHDHPSELSLATEAMRLATELRPYAVNMSFGGPGQSVEEFNYLLVMLQRGTIISVAAGNDGQDLSFMCNYFPACYDELSFFKNKWFVVSNLISIGTLNPSSNYNGPVNAGAIGTKVTAGGYTMTGTSQATANWLGQFIRSRK